jgi:hypothetical protein
VAAPRCRLDDRGDFIEPPRAGRPRAPASSPPVRGLVEVRVEEHASDLHQDSAAVGEPAYRVE